MAKFSDVSVVINVNRVISRLGFGIPLVIEGVLDTEYATVHAYDTYVSLFEVETVFGHTSNVFIAAKKIFEQDNPPEKIACMSTTDNLETALTSLVDQEFRQVIPVSLGNTGESTLKEVADWCETNKRMLFTSVRDTSETSAMTSSRRGYDHTVILYSPSTEPTDIFPEAALVGVAAGKDVGSFTYKNQILKNVSAVSVASTSALETLHDGGFNTILAKAGDIVTSEGLTFSGQYIDIVDSKDWLVQQIEYKVQKVLNNEDKLPYDNNGINLLDSTVIGVLKEAYDNGMIADNEEGLPDYYTDFEAREETNQGDRSIRKYIGGTFGFGLAGAIHEVQIKGYIEI